MAVSRSPVWELGSVPRRKSVRVAGSEKGREEVGSWEREKKRQAKRLTVCEDFLKAEGLSLSEREDVGSSI